MAYRSHSCSSYAVNSSNAHQMANGAQLIYSNEAQMVDAQMVLKAQKKNMIYNRFFQLSF
jgi:hypothetical protein